MPKATYTIEQRQMLVCDHCGPVEEVVGNIDSRSLDVLRNKHDHEAHEDTIIPAEPEKPEAAHVRGEHDETPNDNCPFCQSILKEKGDD